MKGDKDENSIYQIKCRNMEKYELGKYYYPKPHY